MGRIVYIGICVPEALVLTGFCATFGNISLNRLSMFCVERLSAASCRRPGGPSRGGSAKPCGVFAW